MQPKTHLFQVGQAIGKVLLITEYAQGLARVELYAKPAGDYSDTPSMIKFYTQDCLEMANQLIALAKELQAYDSAVKKEEAERQEAHRIERAERLANGELAEDLDLPF